MAESNLTIWDKIDLSQFTSNSDTNEAQQSIQEDPAADRRRRRYFRLLDGLATVFWLYLVIKIFLGDLDIYFIRKVLPSAAWVIDYRFLIIIFAALLVSLVFRKWFGLAILYIAIFPLVVIVWKVPRLIYRRRDWNLAIGILHIATAGFNNHRYVLAIVGFGGLAAILVSAGNSPVVLGASLAISLGLLLVGIYKSIRYAVIPSRFLKIQRRLVDRFMKSKVTAAQFNASDLRKADIQKFSKEQADAFLQRVGNCVIAHQIMYIWAYRIDEYRRSISAIVFSALSVVWMLALMVYCFTIANLSIYKLDHNQYSYTVAPNVIKFIYYSFASLYINEINGLSPQGNGAVILKIVAGFCGAILLLTLIVTLFLSYRQTRDDRMAQQTIDEIRQQGKELESKFNSEFEVTPDEAVQRLQEFGYAMMGIIVFLTKQVPPNWL